MKIVFKNGKELETTQEIVNMIRDNQLKNSARVEIFNDDKYNVILFINVEEIVYIK